MKEIKLSLGFDNHQAVRLGHLRGDLREMLGARHAYRDRQSNFGPHTVSNRFGNFGRRTEEMGAAPNIGKGLVDGDPLDEGRKIADHLDGGVTQSMVLLVMPADKNELRTEFARSPSRHPATDSEGLRFVGRGEHNPTTDSDRPATQRWI
jgi:hypothetical protein